MKSLIRKFVCEIPVSNPEKINDDTLLFEEGIFDSMSMLNLISFMEEHFNIKIDYSELDANNFGSINAIVSFLERKLK